MLNRSFVILDETQNTVAEKMKIPLTCAVFDSKAVIVCDPYQVDLVRNHTGKLSYATTVLAGIPSISVTKLTSQNVAHRHIVDAQEAAAKLHVC